MGSLLKQKFLNIINRDNEKEVKYLRTLHEIFIKIKRPFLLLFIPILLLLLMEIYFYKFSPDDTYIVLRYAHNLFLGNGLTYNSDGKPVEGYSCFLWVLYSSLAFLFNIKPLDFIKISGMILSLINLFLLFNLSSKFDNNEDNHFIRLLPIYLLCLSPNYALWAVGGLETQMFITFLLISTISFLRYRDKRSNTNSFLLGLSFLLLSLTRHEGVLIFILTVLYHVLSRRKNFLSELKAISYPFVIFLLPYMIYFYWRISYYGYFFPNSFYAKNQHFLGTVVSNVGFYYTPILGLLVFLFVFIIFAYLLNSKNKQQVEGLNYLLLISLFIVSLSISLSSWMPGFRYMVPAMPLVFILSKEGYKNVITKLNDKTISRNLHKITVKMLVTLFVLAFIFSPLIYLTPFTVSRTNHFIKLQNSNIELAYWIKTYIPQNSTLALGEVGFIPYYTEMRIVDIHTQPLTDEYLAHNGFNVEYVLDKSPDIIIFKYEEIEKKFIREELYDALGNDYTFLFKMHFSGSYSYYIYKHRDLKLIAGAMEDLPKSASRSVEVLRKKYNQKGAKI